MAGGAAVVPPNTAALLHQRAPPRFRASAAFFAILTWTFCSATLVLYNKFVLHAMNFRFPLFVTMLHCFGVSASLYVASSWFRLFEPPQKMESFPALVKKMVPISLLFALATVMRNYAFISLPISTIQMVNSSSPALVYVFSCIARLERLSTRMAVAVSGISAGVGFSAASAMRQTTASPAGTSLLLGGLILEATRGILLKKMLLNSIGVDSVGTLGLLYVSSTMSFMFLAGPVALTEAKQVFSVLRSSTEPLLPLLVGNVCFAICLNFASFNFLHTCSVTTTSITAVLKDCALFFVSLVVLQGGTFYFPLSDVGVAGYSLSILSTLMYIKIRRDASASALHLASALPPASASALPPTSAEEADGHPLSKGVSARTGKA
jgi:drug/metabolite transporter (DMT)-like permease